jgi:hypothetical protein
MVYQRAICPWEKLLRIVGERKESMGLTKTRLRTQLPDQTITLKTCQLSANGVVGYIQFRSKLIDGAALCPEQTENPASRAIEQALSPSKILHRLTVYQSAN